MLFVCQFSPGSLAGDSVRPFVCRSSSGQHRISQTLLPTGWPESTTLYDTFPPREIWIRALMHSQKSDEFPLQLLITGNAGTGRPKPLTIRALERGERLQNQRWVAFCAKTPCKFALSGNSERPFRSQKSPPPLFQPCLEHQRVENLLRLQLKYGTPRIAKTMTQRLQFYRMRKSILADPVKELRERYANEALSLLNDDEKQNKPLRRKAAVRPGPPMSLNVRSRMRANR